MLVREEGPEIIGNPSTAPFGGLGVDVDERLAYLPAKVGHGAAWAPFVAEPGAGTKEGGPS